jgi:hypothetical protein
MLFSPAAVGYQNPFGGAQSTGQSQHDHAAIHAALSTMVGVVAKPQDIHLR